MISVIVPIYNTSKYLADCLESICNQTYKDLEIILVDDCSTDNSLAICKRYKNLDSRIKVFSKTNSGVSSTRNYGLEKAKGEYVSFCDSDDIIDKNLYEILYNNLIEKKVDRVCCGYSYIYDNNSIVYCKPKVKDGLYKKENLLPIMIDAGILSGFLFASVCNSLFKKKIINHYNIRFKENVKYNEDALFSFEYAIHSNSLYALTSKSTYYYRQHSRSSSHNCQMNYDVFRNLHNYLIELNKLYNIPNFELQMKKRQVTVSMWKIMNFSKYYIGIEAILKIRAILNDIILQKNIGFINVEKLNIYKKSILYLMKYKQASLLYFLFRKIYPFASKLISK